MSAVARRERLPESDPQRLAGDLARQAVASLYDELVLYPKPGLVSLRDSGAHDDMDARTFLRSLFTLRAYFRAIAGAGMRSAPFGELEALGIQAETRMLLATRGVNTHRGAIFTLGLLVAAAAALIARGEAPSDAALRAQVSRWRSSLWLSTPPAGRLSHGSLAALRYGARGARGEAAEGFPAVFECALPAFRAALARGVDSRAARIHTLFTLLASVVDTNLLHRGGRAGLAVVHEGAAAFLAADSVFAAGWLARAEDLHGRCSSLRLSPGGCADLLSAACFVHRVQSG